ncbi:MAG: glycosyltransferase, partial [Anaerolineales bacterium]|nr:glycosyltransferase [Anaerolineales bacterium]
EYLIKLVENPSLRYQMGLEAQATLKRHWLLSDQVLEWAGTFEKLYTASMDFRKSKTAMHAAQKYYQWQREDEAEITGLKTKINDKDKSIQELNEILYEKDLLLHIYNEQIIAIHNSAGWKLLETLYQIRLILAPRGSRRERLMHLMLQSLSVLKNLGLRAMISWWRAKIRSRSAVEPVSQPPPQAQTTHLIKEGKICPIPTISVVIEENVLKPVLDKQEVLDWINQQTLKSIEIVLWERDAGIAHALASPEKKWQATDVKTLCQGLSGRYICLASQDFLQQNNTYLEENLAALESEALIFTVNTQGNSQWATRHLHLERLPGHHLEPLFRLVVRKEYIQDDFSIDLPAWVNKMHGKPSVVGKVIPHTTNTTEPNDAFILDTKIGSVDATHQGRHILARAKGNGEWEQAANILHSMDSVLPSSSEPSGLPTVFVIMPFLAVGGAEQLALHILSSLKEKIRFVVIAVDELDPALGTLTDAFRKETPYVYSIPDFLNLSLRTSFLWYLIEQYQPTSLYIANGAAWIYDLLPEIKQRYPELKTVNQVYDYEAGWINRYDPSLVMALDAHIGTNQKICEAYIDRGAKPEQVHLVEHGIDPSELNPNEYSLKKVSEIKRKLDLPVDNSVVTFASRIHPQKRPMDFVEMARRFSSDPSITFLMMGNGSLADTVDEQISKIGLSNFHRHNFYRPISDILAISDVVVLPSEYEGMPLIIAEAQVMGKPVVVTDVGNNREVLAITQGGVIVAQIGDIDALMEGVHKMLVAPPDPTQVREAFLSHFGIDIISKKYQKVLIGKPLD